MKVKTRTEAPPLDASVVAVVLDGWSARAADGSAPSSALFDLWGEHAAGVAVLWRVHERFLRDEARRLGIQPSWPGRDGRPVFFGEHCTQSERGGHDVA